MVLVESVFCPVAGTAQFQDCAMVDYAVNGRGSCHGVLEYLVPLREDEIGGNQHALALISFCQEGEEHLHLLLLLLHVPDVVYDHSLEPIQAAHFTLQGKVPFSSQEALDQTVCRSKQYRMTLLQQFVADSRNKMGLASSRQTESQDIL